MKSESLQWKKLRPHLVAAKLDPVRVENPIHPGTPDVNLANGWWIELKSMPIIPRPELEDRIAASDGEELWLGLCARCVDGMRLALVVGMKMECAS